MLALALRLDPVSLGQSGAAPAAADSRAGLRRERMSWSPKTAPHGDFETHYLVMDSFGTMGTAYRETDIERAGLETVIADLMAGEFNEPVRVIAFNMLGHWADDVSQQIAEEIQKRCDLAGEPVPDCIRGFVRQLALRLG